MSVKIDDFKPLAAGALRGSCDVTMPCGMRLHRCTLFAKNGKAWAAPPSKQIIGRNGTVQRGADGKARYEPCASFIDRATKDRWSAVVIDAVRTAFPEALS